MLTARISERGGRIRVMHTPDRDVRGESEKGEQRRRREVKVLWSLLLAVLGEKCIRA